MIPNTPQAPPAGAHYGLRPEDFVAAREPRRRDSGAGTASLPQHPAVTDEPERKAA